MYWAKKSKDKIENVAHVENHNNEKKIYLIFLHFNGY